MVRHVVGLRHQVSRSSAKWLLSHTGEQHHKINDLLSYVGCKGNRAMMSKYKKQLTEDSVGLDLIGITVDNKVVHYARNKGVFITVGRNVHQNAASPDAGNTDVHQNAASVHQNAASPDAGNTDVHQNAASVHQNAASPKGICLKEGLKEVKTKEETTTEAEKKPAVVSLASPLLTPNPLENPLLKKTLESLPLALQKDAKNICRSEPASDCVKISNIKLLADCLSSSTGTPIPNPGAWLRAAVRGDYASPTRQQSVAAQDAKEGALRRLAALEKEQERRSQQLAQEGYTPETAETAEFLLALLKEDIRE